ncbi:MAG: ATP-binding cassette domain-containing protein [Saprospiraceae bacterium]|nr:ATP-binding cassette domain-containing protein [Saprospiraceae bacterium]
MILSIDQLHKEYGRITAVDHLSLDIEKGSIFGLLGPNGSGKTTTLGMVLGVTNPTSGSYKWFDKDDSHVHRKRIGAILEKPNFYPTFSGYKNLQIVCRIKGVDESRIDDRLRQVGLFERRKSAFKTYSLGMKQRLAIAAALLSEPEVLILDEPTNGLDPQGIAEIRQLIIDIANTGKTIILASHLLDEVQKICTEFGVLRNGKLIHTGRVDADLGEELIIEVGADNMDQLERDIQQFPDYISHVKLKEKLEVRCKSESSTSEVNKFLSEKGIYPSHLLAVKKNLEQQFLEILANDN